MITESKHYLTSDDALVIRTALLKRNMTITQMSIHAGLTRQSIYAILAGKHSISPKFRDVVLAYLPAAADKIGLK